jgi:transposase InsO family protein
MSIYTKLQYSSEQLKKLAHARESMWPPPIAFSLMGKFMKPKSASDKDEKKDEGLYVKFDVPLNNKDSNSDKYERKVKLYSDGKPFDWCEFRENTDDLFEAFGCDGQDTNQVNKRHHLYIALFAGRAKSLYMANYNKVNAANNQLEKKDQACDAKVLSLVINETAKSFFRSWDSAVQEQQQYMRQNLFLGDLMPSTFVERLKRMNKFLRYFPRADLENDVLIPEEQLITIVHHASHGIMQLQIQRSGKTINEFKTLDALKVFFDQQHECDMLEKRILKGNDELEDEEGKKKKHKKRKKRKKNEDDDTDNASKEDRKLAAKPRCNICGKIGHRDDNCWSLEKNANKRPANFQTANPVAKKKPKTQQTLTTGTEPLFTEEQVSVMMKKVMASVKEKYGGSKKIKRKVHYEDSDSGSGSDSANDNSEKSHHYSLSYTYLFDYIRNMEAPTHKIQNTARYSAEIIVEIVDSQNSIIPIRALLDTGTSETILLKQFLSPDSPRGYKGVPVKWKTLGGNFVTHRQARIQFAFPELSDKKYVTWVVHVDHHTDPTKALYDMVIGMDCMCNLGVYVNTEEKVITWEGNSIPLKKRGELQDPIQLQYIYSMTVDTSTVLKEAEERQSRILDANYDIVDPDEFVRGLSNLSKIEQNELSTVLKKYPILFGGGLGLLRIKPVHLTLREDAKPVHVKAFPIPQSLLKTTKKEIGRLTSIDVLEKAYDSEWAAPTFVKPKKTGDVRILTDFRGLNACLIRTPFPLPKVSDLLQRLTGFRYASAIDLSMGYYHIPLDEYSQKLCTTILPWGKYRYKRLPMGIKNSPDVFQAVINDLLGDLDFVQVYLDDILITSNGSFQDHLKKLHLVFKRLEQANFRANLHKCFFAQDELDYLGYWLTRQGLQPQPKKVEAILRLTPPKTKRQLRHFLGMVNFYRDMWRMRSHLLAPLSALVSTKVKFEWRQEHQDAFEKVKTLISKETLLTFPNFNEPFHIFTDASKYQLGAVIMQNEKLIAFYSRKLNSAQRKYTTGEQELLSVVETLKEFRNILFGQQIVVHTDHKNILYKKLSNDRIIRWRLLLEEYGPEYVHIAGRDNVVADALSRMEADFNINEQDQNAYAQMCASVISRLVRDESCEIPNPGDPEAMASTFLMESEVEEEKFPMSPVLIQKEQEKDQKLQQDIQKNANKYKKRKIEGAEIVTHHKLIVIPKTLQKRIVAWYHHYLAHPGMTRLEATLRETMTWLNMRKDIESHVRTCPQCQKYKKVRPKYGKLPEKLAEDAIPWKRVDLDMIGPYEVKAANGEFTLRALTMIDPATGWFEVKDVPDYTAMSTQAAFDEVWLSRYPRPEIIGFDGGSEFKHVFEEMRKNYGMKKRVTTAYNPQSNGIVERVHLVLADALRTFELQERELDVDDPWSSFLASAAFAIRSTYHTTLGASPGQLVFGRDMLLPIKFKANWAEIRARRQDEIRRNNERENKGRKNYDYKVGDQILLTDARKRSKLAPPREGPYLVERVFANGTILIRRGAVSERVNIRRITPYFEREAIREANALS